MTASKAQKAFRGTPGGPVCETCQGRPAIFSDRGRFFCREHPPGPREFAGVPYAQQATVDPKRGF